MAPLNPLGWAGWFGFGCARLCWTAGGWAGLGCTGLGQAPEPRRPNPGLKRGNAAAWRPQTGQKRTKNNAVSGPKMGRLNPVRERLWQSFGKAHTKGLAWSALSLGGAAQKRSPRAHTPQNGETQRHSGPKRAKNGAKTVAENGTSESGKKKPLAKL